MVLIYGTSDKKQYANYLAALQAAGLEGIVSDSPELADCCQALLLPGGGDIHGNLPAQEQEVIRRFVFAGKPILGICRGMQALNVYFGGTLQDHVTGHQIPQSDLYHATRSEELMADLIGRENLVNSNHHQAVDEMGRNLMPCQWTPDGVTEAFYHRTLPILGVQYHPERQSSAPLPRGATDCAPIFRWLAKEIDRAPALPQQCHNQ